MGGVSGVGKVVWLVQGKECGAYAFESAAANVWITCYKCIYTYRQTDIKYNDS